MRSIVTSTVTGEYIVYQWVLGMGDDSDGNDGNDGICGLILGRGILCLLSQAALESVSYVGEGWRLFSVQYQAYRFMIGVNHFWAIGFSASSSDKNSTGVPK